MPDPPLSPPSLGSWPCARTDSCHLPTALRRPLPTSFRSTRHHPPSTCFLSRIYIQSTTCLAFQPRFLMHRPPFAPFQTHVPRETSTSSPPRSTPILPPKTAQNPPAQALTTHLSAPECHSPARICPPRAAHVTTSLPPTQPRVTSDRSARTCA